MRAEVLRGGPHTKVTERMRLGGQLVVSPEDKN